MRRRLKINHKAIICLVIGHQTLRGLWMTLFSREIGTQVLARAPESMLGGGSDWVISGISSFALCYGMAWFFLELQVTRGIRGLRFALAFWLGMGLFFFMIDPLLTLQTALPYYAGLSLILFAMTGFILGSWNRYEKSGKAHILGPIVYFSSPRGKRFSLKLSP